MNPTIVAIIIGSIAVVGGIYYMATRLSKSTVINMSVRVKELAQMLGLPEPNVKGPTASPFFVSELKGTIDEREFSFTQFTRSEKRAGVFITEFSWACKRTLTPRIIIGKEGIFTPLSKQMGVIDIRIGETEFDEAFLVSCDDADYARKILSEKVRKEILRCQKQWHGTLVIHYNEVHYEESGVLVDEKDLHRMIRLIELSKVIAETLEIFED